MINFRENAQRPDYMVINCFLTKNQLSVKAQ